MLKIWGRNTSSNVQKIMWLLDELGAAHERVDIGGPFGGNKEPPYLAMNPNGLVPTLEEDGLILWESNAILRYLAGRHGRFVPSEPRARAIADQWMDWQISVVSPAIRDAFWGLVRTPPERRDHAAVATSQRQTTEAMRILDGHLARHAYVAGEGFSIGDIPVGIMAYRYGKLVPERPDLPHLARWYAAIDARPAFREHVAAIPFV